MFQKRLRALRNEKGVSQKELAGVLHVSQQSIGKWESGSATPNPETVAKLAQYFQASSDYLLGISDIRNPEAAQPTKADIQFALFGGKVTDEAYEDVKKFAAFVKEKYKDHQ